MLRRFLVIASVTVLTMLVAIPAFAAGASAPAQGIGLMKAGLAIGSGLAIGIAAYGGGIGEGRAIASALDGIARNPGASGKIITPMIIGLALVESLVIYAFVIAFLLQGKI